MKVILDRRSCTCWEAACESCFAGNLLQEYFVPACIVEEIEDGSPDMTIVVRDRDNSKKTLVVTGENWGAVFDSWMLAWQAEQAVGTVGNKVTI